VAFRKRASERGGRSSWRRSGTLRQPPSSESDRRRPLLVPPRSHSSLPGCLGDEPQGWCPRASEARSDGHRAELLRWRESRMCLFMLGATPWTGRPTLYPEGGALWSFPSLPPRLGLPGSDEPRGPLYGGAGRGRRRRRAGPQRGRDQCGAARVKRRPADPGGRPRQQRLGRGVGPGSWPRSPRPASPPRPTPMSCGLAGGACGCWGGWSMRSALNASGSAPG
jgi:hypothetical protein